MFVIQLGFWKIFTLNQGVVCNPISLQELLLPRHVNYSHPLRIISEFENLDFRTMSGIQEPFLIIFINTFWDKQYPYYSQFLPNNDFAKYRGITRLLLQNYVRNFYEWGNFNLWNYLITGINFDGFLLFFNVFFFCGLFFCRIFYFEI